MAAKTPNTITRESAGSLTQLACLFSSNNIDDGDTYSSGIPSGCVKNFWWQTESVASNTTNNLGVTVHETASVFTFETEENNKEGTLYIQATI